MATLKQTKNKKVLKDLGLRACEADLELITRAAECEGASSRANFCMRAILAASRKVLKDIKP